MIERGEWDCETSEPLSLEPLVDGGEALALVVEQVDRDLVKEVQVEVVANVVQGGRGKVVV